MKDLTDLTDELLGVRLQATNVTLWQLSVSLVEAARTALNDALRTYEFGIRRTFNSINLPAAGQMVGVLPQDVHRVVEVYAQATTTAGPRRKLVGYEHRPTIETNLLYLNVESYPGARNLEVLYESRLTDIPKQAVVASPFTVGSAALHVSGAVPSAEWRAPGYLALRPGGTSRPTTQVEVIRYGAVTATSFTGLTRAVARRTVPATSFSLGDLVVPVLEVEDEAVSTLIHAAQAEMYHFWVRNRALYEEFTAIASLQQLDLGDLLGLIRSEEDRADRRYRKTKKPPDPTHVKRKRVRR